MLAIQTANLPPEQRQRVHPDFLANEQAYLRMRPQLLTTYPGQWVAVHQGQVVAAGPQVLAVMEAAAAVKGHPYIAFVGREDQTVFRMRKSIYAIREENPMPTLTLENVSVDVYNQLAQLAEANQRTVADEAMEWLSRGLCNGMPSTCERSAPCDLPLPPGEPLVARDGPLPLPDPPFLTEEGPPPFDLVRPESMRRVPARKVEERLPDPPILTEERSPPYDLPRPGPGKRVAARKGTRRLPEPPIFLREQS